MWSAFVADAALAVLGVVCCQGIEALIWFFLFEAQVACQLVQLLPPAPPSIHAPHPAAQSVLLGLRPESQVGSSTCHAILDHNFSRVYVVMWL